MHPLSVLAAVRAAHPARVSHVAAVVTALIVAAVIIIALKSIARILTPKKDSGGSRPSSPYAASRK